MHTLTSVQYTIDNTMFIDFDSIHTNYSSANNNTSAPYSPLEMCTVGGLLGGALGRMSPQFLLVFYMPDRRENVRS